MQSAVHSLHFTLVLTTLLYDLFSVCSKSMHMYQNFARANFIHLYLELKQAYLPSTLEWVSFSLWQLWKGRVNPVPI